MGTSIGTLAAFLGKPACDLLSSAPFDEWVYDTSIDDDLDEPVTDYVFPDHGLDFTCDTSDRVSAIFVYFDETRRFAETLLDVPLSAARQEVVGIFGPPSKSGDRRSHPILGESGAWDRFSRGEYSLHVEYGLNGDCIRRITLMRADVVP